MCQGEGTLVRERPRPILAGSEIGRQKFYALVGTCHEFTAEVARVVITIGLAGSGRLLCEDFGCAQFVLFPY
jgi:hypothetical protein